MTAWTVVGSVTLWRLRSLLFRFSTQGGRLTSVLILFFTIFHWNRRRKDRRKEHQRTSYSFGITILGAITVVLSHVLRKNRRKSWWIKQLQRVLLISETPRLLYSSFEEKDSDTIGITALLLGTLLGEWNATTVTLCMLTGGEALERACMKNAERSLEALLRKRIHIEKCEILSEGKRIEIPVADMKVGSRYVLRAGSHVPVDSEILSGEIVVDDSALTGEHVHKTISSDANTSKLLLSGSKVLSVKSSDSSGLAYAKALRVASKSTFELMKSALLEAKDSTSSLEIRSYVVFKREARESMISVILLKSQEYHSRRLFIS